MHPPAAINPNPSETATDVVRHVEPADQPHSVHELAARLLPAYRVDGGSVRLAGCTLEDRLFARLQYQCGPALVTLLLDGEGRPLDPRLEEQLGLGRLSPLPRPPRRYRDELTPLIEIGARLATEKTGGAAVPTLVSREAVWCKYTEGKLRFAIGAASVDLEFADWSRCLQPPPYHCPFSGVDTFHLAATDDGRIVAAEQLATCSETGRRVLADELATCTVTGRRVVGDLVEECPVSQQKVLRTVLVECEQCRQRVAPAAIERGLCRACHRLAAVGKADPRMARLLHEHPALDHWKHWRIAETQRVYILTAARWMSRLLLVVDRESLELRVVASRPRFFGGWTVATPDQYGFLLRDS